MSEKELATEFSGTPEPFKTKDLESSDNQNSRDSAHLETQESPDSSKSDRKSKKNQKNKKQHQQEESSKEQEKKTEEKLENDIDIDGGEILRPDMLSADQLDHEEEEDEKYNYDEYGNMDRLDIPKHEKELGRQAFVQGKYEEATKHYSKAILGTNFLFKDGLVPTEEKAAEFLREIQIPCYLNNALCYIKLKIWKNCIESANAALTLDEDNVKALYRKAVGTFNMGNLEETSKLLKRALEIEPNNLEIRNLALELKDKKRQLQDKERKIGQKMVEELAKIREEEQKNQGTHTKLGDLGALAALGKVMDLKNKVVEPLVTKKKEVQRQIKTWKDHIKLLILLPLDIMSGICCKRRLPSQFYKVDENKKST